MVEQSVRKEDPKIYLGGFEPGKVRMIMEIGKLIVCVFSSGERGVKIRNDT